MAKLNKEQREMLVEYLKDVYTQNLTLEQMQKMVQLKFQVEYTLKSISYYLQQALREERCRKYAEENEIIVKWYHREPVKRNIAEELAEAIFSALNHNDNEEYNKLSSGYKSLYSSYANSSYDENDIKRR